MQYQNFDLEVFDHKVTESGERFSVRASSQAGEQRITGSERVSLPVSVRQSIGALRRRQLTLREMIALGEELGKALFPPRVCSLLDASLLRLRSDGEGLRIRLKLDTYALAELPWEYVYLPALDTPEDRRGPEGFLALQRRVSLVRYEILGQPVVSLDPGVVPIRMVALLASPRDSNFESLDLGTERRNIEQAVGDLPVIQVQYYPDATEDSLLAALVKPAHIFHFAGHGKFDGDMGERYGSMEGAGAVVLVGDDGRARPFAAQKLALNLAGRSVRLAVLTACEVGQPDAANAWAGVVTALTRAGIPAVVGMQYRICDTNAVAFSKAFYRALAAGQPIDAAVTDGRLAIFNRGDENERDWGVPVLYLRAIDGVLFPQPGNVSVTSGSSVPRVIAAEPAKGQTGVSSNPAAVNVTLPVDKRTLRETMIKAFSAEELEILCSNVQDSLAANGVELQVNLGVVGGSSKPMQVLNLIEYLNRRGYLDFLVKAVREERPGLI